MSTVASLALPSVRRAHGVIQLPGSKSISNRALLIAALAQGRTVLHGVLDSDDTKVMLASLRQLGVAVFEEENGRVVMQGVSSFPVKKAELYLGNAGTAFRPLTAALACMDGDYQLSGVPRMHERPIGDLVDGLRQWGAQIDYLGTAGYPPLKIAPLVVTPASSISVKGNVSSQFLTALLMAAPLRAARLDEDVIIEVDGPLISQPYIGITLQLMRAFGVNVAHDNWQRFIIPADARYQSPGDFHVEGDASTASYFMALGALGGGPVEIRGVGANSIQGDIGFADVVEKMGARVERFSDHLRVTGPSVAEGQRLQAFDMDFNLIPDAAMTAAAMAIFADGPCTLRNIGSWRVKETDRIDAMHKELEKLGARVESGPDWMTVHPIEPDQWRATDIDTYDDHRIAMCFSLASFGPASVVINDPTCVSKTFPEYFDVFDRLVSA